MHTNECWACKGAVNVQVKYRSAFKANHSSIIDSRVVCNPIHPRCSRCAKFSRPCEYGLRLSWPKATNKKRSLTYSLQDVVGTRRGFSQTSFINATSWDIQLHDYLRMNQGLLTHEISHYSTNALVIGLGSHKVFALQRLHPPMALSWLPINLDHEERELLDHFICMASSTLATFEPDKNEFLSLLVRFALSESSPSSTAVLQSALALSLFHRHGLQVNVFRFKDRALRALILSSNRCIESPAAVQHIAATLKMLGMPNAVSLWFCHLNEARRLIDNADLGSQKFQGEYSRLLDWVEYHMVMSRFSHRHWYKNSEPMKGNKNFAPVEQGTCHSRKITQRCIALLA
ncbi:zinc-finger transcription factor protein [Rutstroemia sp. NJR-2017a WRK4]|nr:zinc-finger transcription factor protein [Rutstroemia sp. NJR-2017a WRK4]